MTNETGAGEPNQQDAEEMYLSYQCDGFSVNVRKESEAGITAEDACAAVIGFLIAAGFNEANVAVEMVAAVANLSVVSTASVELLCPPDETELPDTRTVHIPTGMRDTSF